MSHSFLPFFHLHLRKSNFKMWIEAMFLLNSRAMKTWRVFFFSFHCSRGILCKTWLKSPKFQPIVLDLPKGHPLDMPHREDPACTHGRKRKSLSAISNQTPAVFSLKTRLYSCTHEKKNQPKFTFTFFQSVTNQSYEVILS